MIAVGIITAPRVKPTLARSVKSFRAAGFTERVTVFAEPDSELVIDDDVMVVQNPTTLGNFRNWVRALQVLHTLTDEWLMICEDDIEWSHNAADVLKYDLGKFDRKGLTGAISLYCPIRMGKVLEKTYAQGRPLQYGWYGLNLGRSTWGFQCIVMHREWAQKLLEDKALKAYLDDPRWTKNVDALVADALLRRNREIVYRIPCLVDHTLGDGNSSLGYKADRPELKTKYFKDVS